MEVTFRKYCRFREGRGKERRNKSRREGSLFRERKETFSIVRRKEKELKRGCDA